MTEEKLGFLNDLNQKQREICISDKNLILTACPGSGKTRTLTYRLAFLSTKYFSSNKLNIAITYTNRASDEIKKRLLDLNVDLSTIWTGTIHQFCLEFIIRPYSMFSKQLSSGYRIIDDFVKTRYMNKICEKLEISLDLNDNFFRHPSLVKEYNKKLNENKEIDFNMILNLSYDLLIKNDFICKNLADLLRSIHIDEYQDTNEVQYNILSRIFHQNKAIRYFFIGDINQAIYGGIGGVAKNKEEIDKLFGINFEINNLDGCYRSTQRIIDFYSKFKIDSLTISSESEFKDHIGIINYENSVHKDELSIKIAEIIRKQLELGIPENEICIIAPQWWLLYPLSRSLRTILPEVNFDAPDLTPIKYDPMNVFYLISKLKFSKAGTNSKVRKMTANEIISILLNDYRLQLPDYVDKYFILKSINSSKIYEDDGIKTFDNAMKSLCMHCNIDLEKEVYFKKAYNDFLDSISQRITNYKLPVEVDSFRKCFHEKNGIVINSYHGVKGEEYTTVIAFGLLTGYIPNWNLVFDSDTNQKIIETLKLLYVICSRAKKNLYLISETGRTTRRGTLLTPTYELAQWCTEFMLD